MMSRRTFTFAGAGAITAAALTTARPDAMRAAPQQKAFNVMKSPEEWRAILTPEQYYVLRDHGTERAYTSPLDKTYAKGTYRCAGCGQPVFSSEAKFDSGTGWPSFWKPIDGAIGTSIDRGFFMTRTEVHCSNCGGHLGHVFNDGPKPTGQRFCMNGVAMTFAPADVPPEKI